MHRRRVLLGTGALVSVAGCLSGDEEDLEEMVRGELDVVIDDEPVDLEADRFQAEHADEYSIDFHFHAFDEYWYMEGDRRITFATALDLIPHFEFDEVDGEYVLTVDDATYETADSETTMTFERNGDNNDNDDYDDVDPTEQLLYDGDELLVDVTTDG